MSTLVLHLAAASAAGSPIDLGTLGGTWSHASAVSGDVVVGYSYVSGDASWHAFAYDLRNDAHMRDLGTLGGSTSTARAVSGDVVVGSAWTGVGSTHAFAYDLATDSAMRDLGTLGGTWSVAAAVSGSVVVGYSYVEGDLAWHAFAYDLATDSAMRDLGTLGGNWSEATAIDGAIVAGTSTDGTTTHSFAYNLDGSGGMRDLGSLGGTWSGATSVSGSVVVGSSLTTGGAAQDAFGYDLSGSQMRDLGTLGSAWSEGSAVSGSLVVGSSRTASGDQHAYAYDLATDSAMRDLGTLGGRRSAAVAVSGGVVAGWATTAGGSERAVAWRLAVATATTLGSSDEPLVVGAEVTYTATVSPAPDGGSVEFDDGGTPITGCDAQPVDATTGRATCRVSYGVPGEHQISAAYTGVAAFLASASTSLTERVTYAVVAFYDTAKQHQSGGAVPIKLELQDAGGTDVSSSDIAVTVAGITPQPAPAISPSGEFSLTQLPNGIGYQFILRTKGYPSGTYLLEFTAQSDPVTHSLPFVIR